MTCALRAAREIVCCARYRTVARESDLASRQCRVEGANRMFWPRCIGENTADRSDGQQGGSASAVPDQQICDNFRFEHGTKDYKCISNVIAFVRLWGVAGFQPLEALMSTRLVLWTMA